MNKLIDVQLPFFKPLWRRIAVVVWCYGWAVVEFVGNSPFWAVLFLGIAVYCTHQFFFAFDPDGKGNPETRKTQDTQDTQDTQK